VKIQSRKLQPGGFRDTVCRGWARPMRPLEISKKVKPQQGTTSPRSNLANSGDDDVLRIPPPARFRKWLASIFEPVAALL
jgi:hypothetical protein